MMALLQYPALFPVEAKKFGYEPKSMAKAKSVEDVLDDRVRRKAHVWFLLLIIVKRLNIWMGGIKCDDEVEGSSLLSLYCFYLCLIFSSCLVFASTYCEKIKYLNWWN